MRNLAAVGLMMTVAASSTAWAQAMVEVPNAPPPPPAASLVKQQRAPSRFEILADVAPGLDVPLAKGSYSGSFGPSFTMDGHVGVLIWMHQRRYALVPELSIGGALLGGSPIGGGFESQSDFGSGFSRVHGQAALRVHLPLSRLVAIYARVGFGADYLQGQFVPNPYGPGPPSAPLDASATSFVFEVGVGVMVALGKHVGVGAYVGLPVAPSVRIDERKVSDNSHVAYDRLATVDLTASAVVALRL